MIAVEGSFYKHLCESVTVKTYDDQEVWLPSKLWLPNRQTEGPTEKQAPDKSAATLDTQNKKVYQVLPVVTIKSCTFTLNNKIINFL